MDPFDQDDVPDEQLQPPVEMQTTRILAAPEGVAVYAPPEDASPNDLLIIRYHDFFAVVRELGGSPLQAFQLYAGKLMGAVVTNGQEVVTQLVLSGQPQVEPPPPMAVQFPTQEDFEAYVNGEIDRAVNNARDVAREEGRQAGFSEGMVEGAKQQVAAGTAAGSIDPKADAGENDKGKTTDVPSDASTPPADTGKAKNK